MRKTLCLAMIVAGPGTSAFAQNAPVSSVVRVTCKSDEGNGVGTGFAWNRADQVVTALHVVAGCGPLEIYSEGLKARTTANVKKVSIESDLALLELVQPIGLVPLKASDKALPGKLHTIWGYPRNVKTMQGDDLRFSRVLKDTSRLTDVMTDKEYRASLGEFGYPSHNAVVLRIGSTIQPGHSGAPIFDGDGKVVGIGDGGLHEGIKSINWAIPAASLQGLIKSTQTVPATRPKWAVHFSAEADASGPSAIKLENGEALRFAFSSSLADIIATASPDEMEGVEDLLEDAPDLRKGFLDVYEDSLTGATIAVPKGMKPKFDPKTRMATVSDAKGHVTFFVQVSKTEGLKALKQFETFLNKDEEWKPDPDIPDDRFESDGVLEVEKARYVGEDSGNPAKMMFYSANVEENSFLGTAIVASELDALTKEDQMNFHLMAACIELSGFRLD